MSTLATLPVPAAAVPGPNTLTHEVFVNTLQAMTEHYKSGARTAFPTPLDFVPMAVEGSHLQAHVAPVANGKALVDQILAKGKTGLSNFAKGQQTFVQNQANQLHAKPKPTSTNAANFAAQMDKQHAIAKKQVDDQIDQTFASLKTEGQNNPGLMPAILNTASSFASTAYSVLRTLTSFFTSIVPQVLAWLKSAAEFIGKVADAVKSVGNAVEHALSWI